MFGYTYKGELSDLKVIAFIRNLLCIISQVLSFQLLYFLVYKMEFIPSKTIPEI